MKLIELCDEVLETPAGADCTLAEAARILAPACKLMYEALETARDNIGVPQLDYPAPISYSWAVIMDTLSKVDKLKEEK